MKSYSESRPLHGFIHDIIINILTMPNILAIIVIIETDNTYKKTSKGEITHEKESTSSFYVMRVATFSVSL